MATRRKDSKGRVLHDGERERKNGTYEYRYKDNDGKLRSIYGKDLRILREKEKSITDQLSSGIIIGSGNITLLEMYDRMVSTKNVRESTLMLFASVRRFLVESSFGNRQIKNITETDIKRLIISMTEHYHSTTIKGYISRISQCLKLAVREDRIKKNPCDFPLSEVLPSDTSSKIALSDKEFDAFIAFVRSSKSFHLYAPYLIFLRETGLRASEFAGLSLDDFDLDNRTLHVQRQISYSIKEGKMKVLPLKTISSEGRIWLSNVAIDAFKEITQRIDYFLTLDSVENLCMVSPKYPCTLLTRTNFSRILTRICDKYNECHPECQLHITLHTLRHTCISRIINKGGSVTAAQLQARHSNPRITLTTYTHANRESAAEELSRLFD